MKGKVYLIGAGPGDPQLLTLKGRDRLGRADVIVYDALVNARLLEWTKSGAVKIFAGKQGRSHTKEQNDINKILVRQARRGRQVARLKGGDPFLFGRGGEEAAFLQENHIPFEVIPGLSSASGVSAYAGIPLTDRRLGSMVTLVTGHAGEGKMLDPVDWPRISRRSTLVIFMGLEQLPAITDRLLKLNWSPELPAVAVRWGTTPQQQTVEATLSTLAQKTKDAKLTSPVLIMIGRVVALRKKLAWFEAQPLFGKTIVITRAADQAPEFAHLLEEQGAEVLSFPTIQLLPPKSWVPVDRAITALASFDWLLFTSVNGVKSFFERLQMLGRDVRDLKGVRLGAIGPKTAAQLARWGLRADAFPDDYRAEALAKILGKLKGRRVLVARAQEARDVLPKLLQAAGAQVTVAPLYRTIMRRRIAPDVKQRLLAGEIAAVTFTSSSTVHGFMHHFSVRARHSIFQHTRAAVIGPITAATLREYDIRPTIRAKRYTIEALARAIGSYFR